MKAPRRGKDSSAIPTCTDKIRWKCVKVWRTSPSFCQSRSRGGAWSLPSQPVVGKASIPPSALGWLGVALTGSDTSSNVLFGGLQKISAEQLGLSPTLMAAANSSGGVMGKMIDAQSIVVASTATKWYGHEGSILRFVFLHSLVLAMLVGVLVYCQAYVPPFTALVYK